MRRTARMWMTTAALVLGCATVSSANGFREPAGNTRRLAESINRYSAEAEAHCRARRAGDAMFFLADGLMLLGLAVRSVERRTMSPWGLR